MSSRGQCARLSIELKGKRYSFYFSSLFAASLPRNLVIVDASSRTIGDAGRKNSGEKRVCNKNGVAERNRGAAPFLSERKSIKTKCLRENSFVALSLSLPRKFSNDGSLFHPLMDRVDFDSAILRKIEKKRERGEGKIKK